MNDDNSVSVEAVQAVFESPAPPPAPVGVNPAFWASHQEFCGETRDFFAGMCEEAAIGKLLVDAVVPHPPVNPA